MRTLTLTEAEAKALTSMLFEATHRWEWETVGERSRMVQVPCPAGLGYKVHKAVYDKLQER